MKPIDTTKKELEEKEKWTRAKIEKSYPFPEVTDNDFYSVAQFIDKVLDGDLAEMYRGIK